MESGCVNVRDVRVQYVRWMTEHVARAQRVTMTFVLSVRTRTTHQQRADQYFVDVMPGHRRPSAVVPARNAWKDSVGDDDDDEQQQVVGS